MTVDVNALWMLLVSGAIIGAVKLLMTRLADIEHTLVEHGLDLREIKTKIGIKVEYL